MKTFVKVFAAVALVYITGAVLMYAFTNMNVASLISKERTITSNEPAEVVLPPIIRDPELASLLQQVAIDDQFAENIGITHVEDYENQPYVNGQHTTETYPDGTKRSIITIKQGSPSKMAYVAHEYLHAVWENLPESNRALLSTEMKTLYASDPGFQNRTKLYADSNTLSDTELFSIYCTESSDAFLTVTLLIECNKHIDRSLLAFQR